MITQATKVGGRLHGRKSVKRAEKPLTEDRASARLAPEGAPGTSHPPAVPPLFNLAKRARPLEIDKVQIDFAPTEGAAKLLEEARVQTGIAATAMMQCWLAWHYQAGTAARLRAGQPVSAFPAGDLQKQMYHAGTRAAPSLYTTSVQWTNQFLIKVLSEQTSPESALKRWQAALLGREHWSIFAAQSIRVYRTYCRVVRKDGHLWLALKCIRGRDGNYVTHTLRVLSPHGTDTGRNKRQWLRGYERLARIADGIDPLPGGCLLTKRRGKWCFMLVHDERFEIVVPQGKHLFLRASKLAAFVARYNGRSVLIGENEPHYLGLKRREFIRSRGHATRDSKAWWNYCDTLSHKLANAIVEKIVAHGVDQVTVLAGAGDSALDTAGIADDDLSREKSRFPMQHFQVLLSQKLIPRGVSVVTRANFRSVKRRKDQTRKRVEAKQAREAGG